MLFLESYLVLHGSLEKHIAEKILGLNSGSGLGSANVEKRKSRLRQTRAKENIRISRYSYEQLWIKKKKKITCGKGSAGPLLAALEQVSGTVVATVAGPHQTQALSRAACTNTQEKLHSA